jgi:hypothetical protein
VLRVCSLLELDSLLLEEHEGRPAQVTIHRSTGLLAQALERLVHLKSYTLTGARWLRINICINVRGILLAPVAAQLAVAEPSKPTADKHYPATWRQFLNWFPDDEACARYLESLRWPEGFRCPSCALAGEPYHTTRGRLTCRSCGFQASVTAGTIFDKTRTPLTVWFGAAWYVTSQKQGASALGLQRTLGLGSYQTAWTMMHRFRRAMVRPNRERLQGTVEVDETYVDLGDRVSTSASNRLSRHGKTPKQRVVVAAEVVLPKGIGRIRLRRVPAFSQEYVEPFIRENVAPGSLIRSDGSTIYARLEREGYHHHRTIVVDVSSGRQRRAGELPVANRVASLLHRWLLGTHHGAVQPVQLDHYLDEFAFRFNRRLSRSRGLLFYRLMTQACQTEPVTYANVVSRNSEKGRQAVEGS